jgi:hypothetical protein
MLAHDTTGHEREHWREYPHFAHEVGAIPRVDRRTIELEQAVTTKL